MASDITLTAFMVPSSQPNENYLFQMQRLSHYQEIYLEPTVMKMEGLQQNSERLAAKLASHSLKVFSDAMLDQEKSFWRLVGHMGWGVFLATTLLILIFSTLIFCKKSDHHIIESLTHLPDAWNLLDFSKAEKAETAQLKKREPGQLTDEYGVSDTISFVKVAVNSRVELLKELKKYHLWELEGTRVLPVVFNHYPQNIDELSIDLKKRLFFRSLLPAILLVQEEVRKEREWLIALLDRFGDALPDRIYDNLEFWLNTLSSQEKTFLEKLMEKYRTDSMDELLVRVRAIPVSLMLAQAALESSWGSSRFAFLGNNLFGMWTWNELGIIPDARDADKTHKIAIYDSILSSIRDYVLTLNRLPAYQEFRQLRLQTAEPLELARGLGSYSERRNAYIDDLQRIIRNNQLHAYDNLALWRRDELEKEKQEVTLNRLTETERVPL